MIDVGIFRRTSFLVVIILLALFGAIGVLANAGVVSILVATNAMDVMKWMGLGMAMAVIMSYAGYVSFGHSVFIGIGGFAASYIIVGLYREEITQTIIDMIRSGVPPSEAKIPLAMTAKLLILSVLLATVLSLITAFIVGYAVLRLRGAFFAIATIGVNYVVFNLVKFFVSNSERFKGVASGAEVPLPKTGLTTMDFYWISYIVFIVTIFTAYLVRVSKLGYGLSAIREDEDAAEVVGVDTFRYKMYAFLIAAWLASLWGVVLTVRKSYVIDDQFSLLNSVIMILENAVGGIGTFIGPLIGSVIYYFLHWYTQTLAGQIALLIMGALIIIVVSFAPEGIAGVLRRRIPKLRKYLE